MQFQEEGLISYSINCLLTVNQLLSGTSSATGSAFAKIRNVRLFSAKQVLFHEGDRVERIYIHLVGHLIQTSPRFPDIQIDAGDAADETIFGLIEALAQEPYAYGLTTDSECTLGVIDLPDLSNFLLSNSSVSYHLAEHLSRCYRHMIKRLENSTH